MRYRISLVYSLFVMGCASPAAPAPADDVGDKAEPGPDTPWSETIQSDVLDVMRRQEAMQPAVQALYEQYMKSPDSGFAGIAFEGDGLALYYKGDVTPEMSAALAVARQVGPVQVKAAAFSAAELLADGAAIHDAVRAHGVSDIQRIAYAYDGSGLEVERMPPEEVARIAAARTRAGKSPVRSADQILSEVALRAPVRLSTGTGLVMPHATRTADGSPWNGGDVWDTYHNSNPNVKVGSCTSGFGVNASGRTWILTAAHCASLGDTAKQGSVTWGPINSDQWRYDLLLIDTPGWYLIFDGPPNTSRTKQVLSWGFWAANELVCHSGAVSGTVCNLKQLSSQDIILSTRDSDGDTGYTIRGLISARQMDGLTASRPGDSGGPVFTLDGAGVRAKGTIFGTLDNTNNQVLLFQDWADVINLFGATPRTGP